MQIFELPTPGSSTIFLVHGTSSCHAKYNFHQQGWGGQGGGGRQDISQ